MKFKFIEQGEKYSGVQLASLNNYLQHGLLGDSVVAWVGACDVATEHMVDGEDLLAKARICGDRMLHFIVEKFDVQLFSAVVLQRLFASVVHAELVALSPNRELTASLRRRGDDLYSAERKLSISIATQSPINSLIHFAVNVTNQGTPVETLSLEDLQVDAKKLALSAMAALCSEVESIHQATQKVRWVK